MTDRSKLLALAEAVEKLTGPDKVVDSQIHWGWVRRDAAEQDKRREAWNGPDVPAYTASLDAAMGLVPEGWCKTVADWWAADDGKPPFFADCGDLKALKAGVDGVIVQAWAATPALALCAAALRAQAEALA